MTAPTPPARPRPATLEPCRSCGNDDAYRDVREAGYFSSHRIVCGSCGLQTAWMVAQSGADMVWNRRAPSTSHAAEKLAEALRKALETVVMTIAFIGRDRGTDRFDKTLDQLVSLLVEVDPIIRAALAEYKPTKPEEKT